MTFLNFPKLGKVYNYGTHDYTTRALSSVSGHVSHSECWNAVKEDDDSTMFPESACKSIYPKVNGVGKSSFRIRDMFTYNEFNEKLIQQGDDVTVAIEDSLLGDEYVVLNYCPKDAKCQLAVTPIANDIRVEMLVPFTLTVNTSCNDSFEEQTMSSNTPITFNLSEFDTLFIETPKDVTGIRIKASGRIAVTSGTYMSAENKLYIEMLQPIRNWGTEYVFVALDSDNDIFKIVAAYKNTLLVINNDPPVLFEKAGFKIIRPVTSTVYRVKANKVFALLYVSRARSTWVN